MMQKNHIIQQTGMLGSFPAATLSMLKTGIPSILQRLFLVKTYITHKISDKAALERFKSIPACWIYGIPGFMLIEGKSEQGRVLTPPPIFSINKLEASVEQLAPFWVSQLPQPLW
jgi:hypothetical protein